MEKIGHYEIKSRLGKRGLATLYLASDTLNNGEVALKVLPREFLRDPSLREHFEQTSQRVAQLEQEAIIPVSDSGVHEGRPYLVMRFLKGGTLADRLEQGRLPIAETAIIIKRLAAALDYAHSMGVVHGDLQPTNILFDDAGCPYLSEFGTATLSSDFAKLTGNALGNMPAYSSPETVRGEGKIDSRSDIYALGAILFEMLTGRPPYVAETPAELSRAHLLKPIPRILDLRPDLPYRFNTTINRALAKDPENRFENATALWRALQQGVDEIEADAGESEKNRGPTPVETQEAILAGELDEAVADAGAALASAAAIAPQLDFWPDEVDPLTGTAVPRSKDAAALPAAPASRDVPAGPAETAKAARPETASGRWRKQLLPLLVGSGGLAFCCLALFTFLFLSGDPEEELIWATVDQEGIEKPATADDARTVSGEGGGSLGLATRMARAAATATVQQQLAEAGSTATAAAQARAIATRVAQSTATAQAWQAATRTARAAGERALATVASARQEGPLAGPRSGELVHALDGLIKSDYADVMVRDFLAVVTFTNPYPATEGSWDIGFMFREDDLNSQYRLALQSSGEWTLINRDGEENAEIQRGSVATLNTAASGQNELVLLANKDTGYFLLNERYVATLDLAARMASGDIGVATSMYAGNEIEGKSTGYDTFILWTVEP